VQKLAKTFLLSNIGPHILTLIFKFVKILRVVIEIVYLCTEIPGACTGPGLQWECVAADTGLWCGYRPSTHTCRTLLPSS